MAGGTTEENKDSYKMGNDAKLLLSVGLLDLGLFLAQRLCVPARMLLVITIKASECG